jgi:hypothetical protein
LSNRGLIVFVTAVHASVGFAYAANYQDVLTGNWIQSANGERMRIGKDGEVVFFPVLGAEEIKGILSVGAATDGGNITIKLENSHVCVYRATVLKQAQSINLKLVNGEAATSAKNGCIYGIFNKAELWPEPPSTEETPGVGAVKPEGAVSQLSVESIKPDFNHASKSSSGTVSFKWQTGGGVVRLVVRFTSATDDQAAVEQALSILQDAAPALGSAIKGINTRNR